jgi:hypothetical protein
MEASILNYKTFDFFNTKFDYLYYYKIMQNITSLV